MSGIWTQLLLLRCFSSSLFLLLFGAKPMNFFLIQPLHHAFFAFASLSYCFHTPSEAHQLLTYTDVTSDLFNIASVLFREFF